MYKKNYINAILLKKNEKKGLDFLFNDKYFHVTSILISIYEYFIIFFHQYILILFNIRVCKCLNVFIIRLSRISTFLQISDNYIRVLLLDRIGRRKHYILFSIISFSCYINSH